MSLSGSVLWPRLSKLMHDFPDVSIELVTDEGLTNILSERFDAGFGWASSSRKT